MSEKRAIGKDNMMPWHIPADLKKFRNLTLGHPVIMGRKTFESIGKPLPQRTNIIVTRDSSFDVGSCIKCNSLDKALSLAQNKDQQRVFVIGGGQIYEQTIDLADRLFLTIVKGEFLADTYFPSIAKFRQIGKEEIGQFRDYRYKFLELERNCQNES